MFIYFFFFCIILFFALRAKGEKYDISEKFFLFFLFVFLCTGYMTGSDWRSYELDYYDLDKIDDCYDKHGELVFYLVCLFFNKIGVDFWIFWIALKIICLAITVSSIRRLSTRYRWWVLLFFYAYCALFYYIDNPMRNLIASVIILYNIQAFIEGKTIKQILAILFASCFHLSTVLAAPFLLLASKIKVSVNKALVIIALLYAVSYTFWASGMGKQVTLAMALLFGEDNRGAFYLAEGAEGASVLSVGIIFQLLLFLYASLIYKKRQNSNTSKYDLFCYNISFFYCCSLMLESAILVLGRLSMFLFLPYILFIVKYVLCENANKQVFRIAVVCFLFLVVYKNITVTCRYVPYTSYVEYIFKKKPSYDYRSSYNYLNSPYKKDNEFVDY